MESSTYGSELVAMRIGDNNSVIVNTQLSSSSIKEKDNSVAFIQLSSSSIKEKDNSVAFYKARDAVAAGYVRTGHIASTENPSEVLTKAVSPT